MQDKRRAASIAIFFETEILLVKRAYAPSAGFWTLPGGRLEPGETPEICIRREIGEELGLMLGDVKPVAEHAVADFRLTVFATRLQGRTNPNPNDEIADWRWLPFGAILPTPATPQLGEILQKARATLTMD